MQSPMFSIYKPNSNSTSFGRFLEGDELWDCYDIETEFPAGLTRVKEETLSGSGRVTAWVTGLRHFPYLGAIRLAGLSSSKTKTLSRVCFILIP
jgi:hypothetical protein